jgi:hypothetical protein
MSQMDLTVSVLRSPCLPILDPCLNLHTHLSDSRRELVYLTESGFDGSSTAEPKPFLREPGIDYQEYLSQQPS